MFYRGSAGAYGSSGRHIQESIKLWIIVNDTFTILEDQMMALGGRMIRWLVSNEFEGMWKDVIWGAVRICASRDFARTRKPSDRIAILCNDIRNSRVRAGELLTWQGCLVFALLVQM
jgi:hypothetical protein